MIIIKIDDKLEAKSVIKCDNTNKFNLEMAGVNTTAIMHAFNQMNSSDIIEMDFNEFLGKTIGIIMALTAAECSKRFETDNYELIQTVMYHFQEFSKRLNKKDRN